MIQRLRPGTVFLEVGLMGVFFLQALRFLIGSLYSRIASVSLQITYPPDALNPDLPGMVEPSALSNEIALLGLVVALPILTLLVGRTRYAFLVAIALLLVGRGLLSLGDANVSTTIAAEMVIGGGLVYLALLVYQRAQFVPYFFVLGFAGDQLVRAFGNTLDPSIWGNPAAQNVLLAALVVSGAVGLLNVFAPPKSLQVPTGSRVSPQRGMLPLWGAVGMGSLLFLELALLALPNALVSRADADYTLFTPWVFLATLLPIVPAVREQTRKLIAPFAAGTRGWLWLLLLLLLLVIGLRIQRLPLGSLGTLPLGAVALIAAQFVASMVWWWFVRPRGEQERNLGSLWLIVSVLIFGLLVGADIFTYEYAFVRDFAPPLDALNSILPPLLRGLRGLGLAILLLAAFFASLPMIQSTRRIPWKGADRLATLFTSLVIIAGTGVTALAVQPPQAQSVTGVSELRIGTYNIHAGYSEFFAYDLESIARTIEQSGAAVVLLQEVEAGRLTSYGVDQSLWLARRLGMDRRFYPTNEGLHGLAVLSRVPIVFDDGVLLPSEDKQTGLQRVQIQPDASSASVITLYNTELGLLLQRADLSEQESNQHQQLESILSTIASHIENDYGGQLGRTVLGGTFHNVPSSPLMQRLSDIGFVDPFAGSNIELSATLRRSNLPPVRYDYIWLWSQSLRAIGTNVMPGTASDHRMAVVGVTIRSE